MTYSRGLYFIGLGQEAIPVPAPIAEELISHHFHVEKLPDAGYAYVANDRGRSALATHRELERIEKALQRNATDVA